MPDHTLDGSQQTVSLTDRLSLVPSTSLLGKARVHSIDHAAVSFGIPQTGEETSEKTRNPTLSLASFQQAEPPVTLDLDPVQTTSTTAEEDTVAMLSYQPDPYEGAACLLLHEIHTPDGIIYDVSLPEEQKPPDGAVSFGIGDQVSNILQFPFRRLIRSEPTPPETVSETDAAVSFGIGDMLAKATESTKIQHVLHILKTPVEQTILNKVAEQEPVPQVFLVNRDGNPGEPLIGANAWRSRFDPAKEHRVLLFIHGFTSNVEKSLPREWMKAFAPHYDAVIAYDHPTIAYDPLHNAQILLEQIPDDIRLNTDIIVHSRGGLVSRSLVELLPATPKLAIRKLLTCGSPHGGTALAQRKNWDRLISIGLTTTSWFSAISGVGVALTFAPILLELIMRAASQYIFDLPGLQAMDPDSEFLKRLNTTSGDAALSQQVQYAAISSTFPTSSIRQKSFRDALLTMSMQAFIGEPNDLVVPTESMSHIDPGTSLLGSVYHVDVNHFGYFDIPNIQNFAGDFLIG